MTWTVLPGPVRSSTRRGLATLLAVAVLAATSGCLADDGTAQSLQASEGTGDLVVFLALQEGQLTRADAWWAEDAPSVDVALTDPVERLEVLVLKNDVVVAREPMFGTPQDASVAWRSAESGTTAQAGDAFELLVVDTDTGDTIASYRLAIER